MLVINRMIRALNAKAAVPCRKELKRRMENMRLKLQEDLGVLLRAKVGMAAIPECQDSSLLAKQVRIVSVDVCGF